MHRNYRRWARRFGHGPYGHGHGHGGHGLHGRRFPNREEWLRALEEHQRDLEQETADVADLIRRLKDEPAETATV
jgi:hypothetical protein